MTINATAATLLAMYIVVAEERGIPRAALGGTIQNDILKEYIARGTYIYPPEPILALIAEIFRFCAAEVPNWNPISISGYHIREAGATAVQELAFTFANAMEYVRARASTPGSPVDAFAPRLSFFFAAHNDLFEEVAKFRAARRMYARLMRERFGASDASCRLRFHTQTGGVTLQAQQPLNNVVRVTVQALAAVLGGTQSLHTNGYDEALSLPTARGGDARAAHAADRRVRDRRGAHRRSARRQLLRRAADRRSSSGRRWSSSSASTSSAARRTRSQPAFFQEEIARSAYEHQMRVERGETVIVGVNRFTDESPAPDVPAPDFSALERDQVARLRAARAKRDPTPRAARSRGSARQRIGYSVRPRIERGPLMPPIVDAVRARASVGEIATRCAIGGGRTALLESNSAAVVLRPLLQC